MVGKWSSCWLPEFLPALPEMLPVGVTVKRFLSYDGGSLVLRCLKEQTDPCVIIEHKFQFLKSEMSILQHVGVGVSDEMAYGLRGCMAAKIWAGRVIHRPAQCAFYLALGTALDGIIASPLTPTCGYCWFCGSGPVSGAWVLNRGPFC